MFDLGWGEMGVIAIVALIVLGPKELPNALRTMSMLMKNARKLAGEFQSGVNEIIREADLEDARKKLTEVQSLSKGQVQNAIEKAVDPTGEVKSALTIETDPTGPARTDTTAETETPTTETPAAVEAKPAEEPAIEHHAAEDHAVEEAAAQPAQTPSSVQDHRPEQEPAETEKH